MISRHLLRHRRGYELIDARAVFTAQPLHCLFERPGQPQWISLSLSHNPIRIIASRGSGASTPNRAGAAPKSRRLNVTSAFARPAPRMKKRSVMKPALPRDVIASAPLHPARFAAIAPITMAPTRAGIFHRIAVTFIWTRSQVYHVFGGASLYANSSRAASRLLRHDGQGATRTSMESTGGHYLRPRLAHQVNGGSGE